ncbi:MAG TPA: hypothetical protein VI423_04560 [Paenisporosarcina sp.]|nr:hypothetical protein [Paenisporosarcina sp.]
MLKIFFAASTQQKSINDLQQFLRPIFKSKDDWLAIKLLRQMRKSGSHFSLVYRYNVFIGFVTMDTLLSVLLGRIKDEFHKTRHDWTLTPDGSYLIRGNASLYAIERALDIDIAPKENVSTITGLI